MQQLLRYGAFAELLTSLQTLTTIEAAAEALSRQWKFCANVGDWSFVSMVEREALRIETAGGKTDVQRLAPTMLTPAERLHATPSASGRLPTVGDVVGSDSLDKSFSRLPAEQFVLSVRVGGRALGAFIFDSDIAGIDTLDRKFIDLVASLFAARVTDLMSHGAETAVLRQQATVDSLTQISNRRQFDARLEIEWLQATRDLRPLSLILLDIDFFKQYNDFYGHPRGDVCLRDVARILQSVLRAGELVARVGGEEFGILLPGVELRGAILVAERARAAIVSAGIPNAGSTAAPHVTVSLGISSRIPGTVDLPSGLYSEADAALYAAKRGGRNCVRASSAD